ncbi:MAG: hypothetical protein K5655_09320 [Lachnospiraceae bacterium]|nr:hypothetical protein [Lachnospiraceae bacterium]
MKLVDLKCPNCNSTLTQEGEKLVCPSCGAVFAIDYDESDVEHERIKTEAELEEKRQAHEKEMIEREFELREQSEIKAENKKDGSGHKFVNGKVGWAILIAFIVVGCISSFVATRQLQKRHDTASQTEQENKPVPSPKPIATPTPALNYSVTPEDIEAKLDDFIESGKNVQMNDKECNDWDGNGPMYAYTKKSVEFIDAYIVNDIPDTVPLKSNRLVITYRIVWESDTGDEKTCFDAVYFEGLKVNQSGGIISDFSAKTIFRSQAGWGWPFAKSFEDYDQCYRENVTALGGTVTAVVKTDNAYVVEQAASVNESPAKRLSDEEWSSVNDALSAYSPGYYDFALKLLNSCRKSGGKTESLLVSPFSMFVALAMTSGGAVDETLAEMENVLGMSVNDMKEFLSAWFMADGHYRALDKQRAFELKDCPIPVCKMSDSIWINDESGIQVNDDFIDVTKDTYYAEVFSTAFDDALKDRVNKWVADNTDDKIKSILSETPQGLMLLINTLLFEDTWRSKYPEHATTKDVFTNSGGEESEISFMKGSADRYLEDELSTGMKKSYLTGRFSFAAILPNEGVSVDELLEGLTPERFQRLVFDKSQQNYIVTNQMPKFSYDSSFMMKDLLIELGMPSAFDSSKADFSGIGDYPLGNIYIDEVLHKTHIDLDEEGTAAEAATVIVMSGMGGISNPETREIIFDRPFVYMIIDEMTQLPMFMGVFEG